MKMKLLLLVVLSHFGGVIGFLTPPIQHLVSDPIGAAKKGGRTRPAVGFHSFHKKKYRFSSSPISKFTSSKFNPNTRLLLAHDDSIIQVAKKKNQLRSLLLETDWMEQFTQVQLELVVQLMKERTLTKNEIICKGGEEAKEIFIVKDGSLESYNEYEYDDGNVGVDGINNNETSLFNYQAGDAVGAISYGINEPYLYSVRVSSEKASVWSIDYKTLDAILEATTTTTTTTTTAGVVDGGDGGEEGTNKASLQNLFQSKYFSDESTFSKYLNFRSKYDLISRCGLFDNLTDNDKQAVVEKLVPLTRFSKGQLIIKEGEIVDNPDLYLVEEGVFECFRDKDPKTKVKTYKKGSYFGELATFLRGPRRATVRVVTDSAKVYAISREDLLSAIQESSLSKAALPSYKDESKSLRNVYEYLVLKSLPKRKPVSFHSILSTMVLGASLLMMLPHFAPMVTKKEFRVLHLIIDGTTHHHVKLLNVCNFGMLVIMLMGWFRFPKKNNVNRIVGMATINTAQAWHTFTAFSNLMGPGYGIINAWSWPGKIFLGVQAIATCIMTGLLYNVSLFGRKKGMDEQPFFESRLRGFLATTVFNISNFGQLFHSFPMFDTMAKFETMTYPLYKQCVGNAQCLLVAWKFLSSLYLSVGGFIATLQFEKRFSIRTCNVLLGSWAVITLTDLYKFFAVFRGSIKQGSQPHIELVSYLHGILQKYHIHTAWFGTVASIVLYGAFQRFVRKREMTGFFAWKGKKQTNYT